MKKIKQIKFLDLFSWIGGFRKSLELLGNDLWFETKCVWFSEIDKFATNSYKSNYCTDKEHEIWDIVNFVENNNINKIEDFDILFWWFPCQPFSMMWKQLWLNDDRWGLFFSVMKIVEVKMPKYILLENVRNLFTHNNWETYNIIKTTLEISWYNVYEDIFNTSDYWLPQTRRRLYIYAVKRNLDSWTKFDENLVQESFKWFSNSSSINIYNDVLDWLLDLQLDDDKYFLSEKIKPTILSNWTKSFKSKSEINQLIARPLTASMVKMHRACQDNYYSQEFLDSKCKYTYLENKFDKDDEIKHKIRKITPWEALKLQWFWYDFYTNASNVWISDHQLYKQAWNAVSINTVYSVLRYLIDFNYIK